MSKEKGDNVKLVDATEAFVEALFADHSDRSLPFHDLEHTREVVDACRKLGKDEGLSHSETELLTVAAWLHDIGYFRTYSGHEEASVAMARPFLAEQGIPEERIDVICDAIMSTRMPQSPSTTVGEVLCDADMSHLSAEDLPERTERLRKEWRLYAEDVTDDREWDAQNLRFLEEHRYFTKGATKRYRSGVDRNIEIFRDRLAQRGNSEETSLEEQEARLKRKKKLKKLKKKVKKLESKITSELSPEDPMSIRASAARPDRGIETMFRTTSRNHIDLSAMADAKANILISVNAIILSIVASMMFAELDTNPTMIVPTMILMAVCLATIVAAILATRPKVTSGTFTQEDIARRKVNLLFFGNFHGVGLDDYEQGVYAMMRDPDYLYGSMVKDIYYLGNVLGRKYRYLRIAFNIFMYGLIATVLAFAIAIFFVEPGSTGNLLGQ